ncbi:MAG: serine hydrolase, partial [Anaerolineae bacterium]|nr:serine hydrolase [Anaerolineae bacterium]
MNARYFKSLSSVLLILALALPALAIAPFAGAQEGESPEYWPSEDWRTSTPEEQGMDSAQLLAALDYGQQYAIDSITVIRHGYVVLDAAFYPYTRDMKHQIWSATKSFTATLVGIAMDQGLIAGLDQPVLELFPDRTVANVDAHKQAMTVRNLLTMSSGIDCTPNISIEAYDDMLQAPDAVQYILDLRAVFPPGLRFDYCDLNSHVLTGAVTAAAGMPLLDYADRYLFGPLGITDYVWQTDQNGVPFGYDSLYLTPHDMARLGYLYLHGGEWAGEPIVSSAWVDTVTCADPSQCPFYELDGNLGYGYHWWLWPHVFSAHGLAGQYIAVAPEYDMVVVITSSGNKLDQIFGSIPLVLINGQFIGAARSEEPLPANPEA